MAVVRVRGRGQVTIPLSLHKDLHLDEEADVDGGSRPVMCS